MENKEEKVIRDLYISGEIDNELATEIISHINEINKEDLEIYNKNQKLNEKNQIPYEPISITINSCGGSVIDGCARINGDFSPPLCVCAYLFSILMTLQISPLIIISSPTTISSTI